MWVYLFNLLSLLLLLGGTHKGKIDSNITLRKASKISTKGEPDTDCSNCLVSCLKHSHFLNGWALTLELLLPLLCDMSFMGHSCRAVSPRMTLRDWEVNDGRADIIWAMWFSDRGCERVYFQVLLVVFNLETVVTVNQGG